MPKRKNTVNLYERNVCAPPDLDLHDDATDRELRRWWEMSKTYAEAMRSLDRVVMLVRDDDEGRYYLASIEETPDAQA